MAARANVYCTSMLTLGVFVEEAHCELGTLHTNMVIKTHSPTCALTRTITFYKIFLPLHSFHFSYVLWNASASCQWQYCGPRLLFRSQGYLPVQPRLSACRACHHFSDLSGIWEVEPHWGSSKMHSWVVVFLLSGLTPKFKKNCYLVWITNTPRRCEIITHLPHLIHITVMINPQYGL